MGGVISLLLSIGEIAAELAATTGLTLETILTGEALAALEAEITSVMTIQGISGIEALAQLGFTAEQFSNMSLVASVISEGIGYATIFQTVSGASALVAAGIRLAMEGTMSTVNSNTLFHGGDTFLRHSLLSFPLDPLHWESSIIHAMGDTPIRMNPNIRNIVASGRWVVQSESAPDDMPSGNRIYFQPTSGGTHQQSCADWMLPLILGLSGIETAELRNLEDGSKKKNKQ